jgi:hypothetical protein
MYTRNLIVFSKSQKRWRSVKYYYGYFGSEKENVLYLISVAWCEKSTITLRVLAVHDIK